jgi:fatty acid desaturase
VHSLLLLSLLALGAWPAALAWCGGMAIFFPVFATLRPLLEHRPAKGDSKILVSDRASVTRVFDDGLFARVFGGAGFNRHLLHHWEPSISYTRLADLDRYLSSTSIGSIVDERRTTYRQAFLNILASDRAN